MTVPEPTRRPAPGASGDARVTIEAPQDEPRRGWIRRLVAWIRHKNHERLARRRGVERERNRITSRARWERLSVADGSARPQRPDAASARASVVRAGKPRAREDGIVTWLREMNRARLALRRERAEARAREELERRGTLAVPRAPPPPLPPHVANRTGPRVLFVDTVYPRPDRDSGSVTARYLIDLFLELGWQVTFFAEGERSGDPAYARALEDAGVRCIGPPARQRLERFVRAEGASFSLCLLFRVDSGGRHYETIRRHCPDAKVVFETVDLHFLREERQARLAGDRRALNVALGVRERELYVARGSDLTIVVSEFEHQLVQREVPGVRSMVLPLILDVPGARAPFSARSGVCFIGGYLHRPNVDAVTYFLDEIWPRVVERLPSCVFHIVGSDMPDAFRARASGNVVPVGYVPDLDGFLDRMRLTVAPLRYGAGVKGKIGSSLASGVPCVTTSIGAEGMGLTGGEAIAIADPPAEFADRIVSLHEDEAAWTRMSKAGWRYVSEQYSLDAARRRVVDMLRQLDLPIPSPPVEGTATPPVRRVITP